MLLQQLSSRFWIHCWLTLTSDQQELQELQESLLETPHVGVLVALTKSMDQAKAVLVVLDACSDMTTMKGT